MSLPIFDDGFTSPKSKFCNVLIAETRRSSLEAVISHKDLPVEPTLISFFIRPSLKQY